MSAAVFVVPTCIGLSAHHAMSYGVPVVTDDSLDSQASEFEIIADGLNSLTYHEGDVASLAEAIGKVTANSAFRSFLSANAIRTIQSKQNLARKAAIFFKLNTTLPR